MNQKQKILREIENTRLLRFSNRSGSHNGCIRISPGNTYEHELRKFQVCWELSKRGHSFITEAVFNNGKRADILDLTEGIVYEILHTEKLQEAKKKVEEYPDCLEIRFIKTTDKWRVELMD